MTSGTPPGLVDSDFHALDGVPIILASGFGRRSLCVLMAHYSCASIEAYERRLMDALSGEFLTAAIPSGPIGAAQETGESQPLAAVNSADMTSDSNQAPTFTDRDWLLFYG